MNELKSKNHTQTKIMDDHHGMVRNGQDVKDQNSIDKSEITSKEEEWLGFTM